MQLKCNLFFKIHSYALKIVRFLTYLTKKGVKIKKNLLYTHLLDLWEKYKKPEKHTTSGTQFKQR